MKITFLIPLLLLCFDATSQPCNCSKALSYVEHQFERNLASYQHQVIELHTQKAYTTYKHRVDSIAALIHNQKDCLGVLARYAAFFKDGHLFMNYVDHYLPFKNMQDTPHVKKYFAKDPVIKPNNTAVKNKSLEGVWYFQDASFSVAIIADKSYNRQWAGLITATDGYLYTKGQLKLEIFSEPGASLRCLYWRGSRLPKCYPVTLTDSTLMLGRMYTFYRKQSQAIKAKYAPPDTFIFSRLSAQTNYLRIPSFDMPYQERIDSLVSANLHYIKNTPNLLIDVRNNGGGGDPAYYPLLPLVFESNILPRALAAAVWMSPDNYAYYKGTAYDYAQTRQDSIESEAELDEFKQYIGRFTPVVFGNDTIDSVYHFPKRVAILTNRGCASTTEGFVALAKGSAKVIQAGENTGGFISYGDWRKVNVPGLPVWISMTTKKMVFKDASELETTGLAPALMLNPNEEHLWIEQTRNYLEK